MKIPFVSGGAEFIPDVRIGDFRRLHNANPQSALDVLMIRQEILLGILRRTDPALGDDAFDHLTQKEFEDLYFNAFREARDSALVALGRAAPVGEGEAKA